MVWLNINRWHFSTGKISFSNQPQVADKTNNMKRTVKQVNYNNIESKTVGVGGVVEILEHEPIKTFGKWYYDVHHEDGTMLRVFNFQSVLYNSF